MHHHLTLPEAIAGTISVALLLVQLALLRSLVLAELINLYAVQSLFVALISLAVAFSRTRTNWIGVSALYLVAQILISMVSVVTGSKAWMATASLVWIVLYKIGTASLAKGHRTADPNTSLPQLQPHHTNSLA